MLVDALATSASSGDDGVPAPEQRRLAAGPGQAGCSPDRGMYLSQSRSRVLLVATGGAR